MGTLSPPRAIKYREDNQKQLFILPKHALESLYLRFFNKRSNESHSVIRHCCDKSCDRGLQVEEMVNLCHIERFSGYWKAEIETLCYDFIYANL